MGYTKQDVELALSLKRLEEGKMRLRMELHKATVKGAIEYNLPYRLIWNEINGVNKKLSDCEPFQDNYYPTPKTPQRELELKQKGTWYESITDHFYDEEREETITKIVPCKDAEYQKQKHAAIIESRGWDLETESGRKKWEFLFARVLYAYKDELKAWGKFDFWGNLDHTTAETEQKRNEFLDLIADFERNPSKFQIDPRPHPHKEPFKI